MISDMQEKPLACWPGKERLEGEVVDSLTVIFRSGGCSWNACRMCSYRHERTAGVDPAGLTASIARQVSWVEHEHRIEQYPLVKIYTSGSFFDPGEVPPPARSHIARTFRGKRLIVESRPEYALKEAIGEFVGEIDTGGNRSPFLYVAIGLETADDYIREKSIHKGFSFQDYIRASKAVRAAGAGVKTYLLHKPLFLTEEEAIADMISSVKKIEPYTDLVSMNPCSVQRRTELEWYWRQRAYRPSYLWSIIHILRQAGRFITCDPLGGGRARGPHNCGTCDREFVGVIRDYSLSGDTDLLDSLWDRMYCCREEWEFVRSRELPYCLPLTR